MTGDKTNQFQQAINNLRSEIEVARQALSIPEKVQHAARLEHQMAQPDFWNDTATAQQVSKQHASLIQVTEPWQKIASNAAELGDFIALDDAGLEDEIGVRLTNMQQQFEQLKKELRYNGAYDTADAVVTIQAGAGGTDAQDWVAMLLRMYTKWAQKQPLFKATLVSEAPGEEAGYKNVTLLLEGYRAYGNMRSEHGVHRLVRMSPFNSAQSRETSFAMVEVVPQISTQEQVEIDKKDLKIDVFRSGGRGGQSVNTTDSAVRVTHTPTGITVAIQNERSQLQNKETAMQILMSKLLQLSREQHEQKLSALRGPNVDAAWGSQIRSYVLHPYTLVKDTRTQLQTNDVVAVLDGEIDAFIEAYLDSAENIAD